MRWESVRHVGMTAKRSVRLADSKKGVEDEV